MTQSEVQSPDVSAQVSASQAWPNTTERRLRRISAWVMLIFLFQGGLGAVWDREWHAYIGRDQFWTPPHTLIYSCVAGAGLMALALVLVETIRYRKHSAGVNDSSTVRVFWFFHAPLGFTITGFGALLALTAAPLDNYWHELYGIDIAMWAPFHMMGITGGLIGILGMVYVFASEAAIDRQSGRSVRRFLGLSALEWGALLVLSSLMNFALTGFLQFPIASFGPLHIATYPLPLVVSATFCFIAASRLAPRPGVATLLVLLLLLQTLAVELFVPWAVRTAVVQQGLAYRIPGHIPYFSSAYAFLPLVYLISALMVDGVAFWNQHHERQVGTTVRSKAVLGVIMAPPIILLAPFILVFYSSYAAVFLPEPGVAIPLTLNIFAVVFSVIVVLAMGALGASMGTDFGDIWRWNTH